MPGKRSTLPASSAAERVEAPRTNRRHLPGGGSSTRLNKELALPLPCAENRCDDPDLGCLANKEVPRMSVYVLVGGGWLGGWCWQRIARRLREEGHDTYPATLTGLGERVHLASPEVDLDTHITDVVNLIEFEDLNDVVLLGHSYAGLVVT